MQLNKSGSVPKWETFIALNEGDLLAGLLKEHPDDIIVCIHKVGM